MLAIYKKSKLGINYHLDGNPNLAKLKQDIELFFKLSETDRQEYVTILFDISGSQLAPYVALAEELQTTGIPVSTDNISYCIEIIIDEIRSAIESDLAMPYRLLYSNDMVSISENSLYAKVVLIRKRKR